MRLFDRRSHVAAVVLTASVTSMACGANAPSTPSSARLLVSAPLGLFQGDTGQATAGAIRAPNAPTAGIVRSDDVTSQAAWQSANTSVVTVSVGGVVTAVGPGTTSLTATYQGTSASDTLTVLRESDLLSLAIPSCPTQLLVGQTVDCLVTMTTTGPASGLNVAATATWSSTNAAVLSVAGGGHATAISAGQATITATYHGKNASLAISVAAAEQDALRVDSATPAGQFKIGNLVSISFRGICSVVSAASGELIVRLLDQNGIEFGGTFSSTIANGSTSFFVPRQFLIPQNTMSVCAVPTLQVGSKTIAATGLFGAGLCVSVSP